MYEEFVRFVRDWYATEEFIPLHEPRFSQRDFDYVNDAIRSTYVSSVGQYVDRFEQQLAEYVGVASAVAVVNGTSALQVALRVTGVQAGDEVITQPLTFVATANAITYNGAHPVFIDVDRETLGLCPKALAVFLNEIADAGETGVLNRKTGRRIAAIVPMHTFGHPCQMAEICEIAEKWGIPVVEDAAEALGTRRQGQHCGTFGSSGVFSLNGNKVMTCGGGGVLITNDERVADRAKHLTTTARVAHPWESSHDEIGYNFRMPNLNAALACAQLEQLEAFLADKRLLAAAYVEFFRCSDWGEFIAEPAECESNYWLNTLLLPNRETRDAFLAATNDAGIMTRPAWHLLNELAMYRKCQHDLLHNAKWLSERLVNVPSSVRQQ